MQNRRKIANHACMNERFFWNFIWREATTWCGEQIDDKGIGNGVSLLIFASIVSNWSSLYTSVTGLLTQAASGKPQYYFFLPLLRI